MARAILVICRAGSRDDPRPDLLFRVLGLGFWGLGFWGLGFWVLGLGAC